MNQHYRYQHPSKIKCFIQCIYKLKLLMIVVVSLMGAAYIAEANTVSSHGIKIKLLQSQIVEERRNYGQLEIQVATNQSMNTLEARVQSLQMVPAGRPIYISLPSGAVALR